MESRSRLSASVVNSSVAMVMQILILISTFVMQTVFIKTLGVEYLGAKGLFTNLVSFLSFAELGVGAAITYSLYKPLSENDHQSVSAVMNLFKKTYNTIGFVILFTGVLLSFFIKDMVRDGQVIPHMQLMFILFLLNTVVGYFFTYMRSLLIASQQGYVDSLNRGLFIILLSVVQIFILWTTHNFLFFLTAQIIVTIVSNISITRTANKMFPYLTEHKNAKVSDEIVGYMKKNIFGTISSRIGSIIVFGTDNILISKFIGLSIVGIYSNYMLIISGISSLMNQMLSAVVSSLGNLGVTANVNHQLKIFYRYLYVVAFISYTTGITLIIVLTPFIKLWIGKGYELKFLTLILIILNYFIIQMRQASLNFISARGLYWPMRWKSLIEAAFNLLVSLILLQITNLGIDAVIIGSILNNIFVNVWWEPLILFKHGFKSSIGKYVKMYSLYFLTFIFSITIIYFYLNRISTYSKGIVELFSQSILVFITSIIIFVIIFSWTKEEKYFFNLVFSKINALRKNS
ncbi:lipopolysaccharide biosynthesis protein [Leuconostoc lactis]|uniref:lipopolysaccharide biosynthesis protein n=1 Tax=Leuconostoc lactis TaxID=1246 RepID=UPI0009FC3226|nr:hypothetical protein [Leuconostoc lactis]ORI85244.1 hypothetical protein BMS94_01820 [Leuconostoc lactis]ORI87133.1 hypothetical protein BMS96_02980 [Leuconostoc lactis]